MKTRISIRNMGFESGCRLFARFLPALSLLPVMQPAVSDGIVQASLANEDQRFHEVHEPEVNVSGNVIVGVMSTSVRDALMEDTLGVLSTETGNMKICLKVTSRDGAYMSQNEYSFDVTAPTLIYLPYQSGMRKVVNGYAERQGAIAVSATSGDCRHSVTADFYLPAKLDKDNAALESSNLSILINGFDATDVFYQITGTGTDRTYDCNYIEEGRHTAYNFSCEIPRELLAGSGAQVIMISREVYGRELEPVVVRMLSTR